MSRFADSSSSDTMMALLAVLTSPDDLKAKLDNLREQERQANERIALAGEADQIIVMRQNIEILQKEAVDALEQAKAKAQTILDEAEQKACNRLAEIEIINAQSIDQISALKTRTDNEIRDAHEQLERDRMALYLQQQENEQALANGNANLEERRKRLFQIETDLEHTKNLLTQRENELNVREKNLEMFQRDTSVWHAELMKASEQLNKDLARLAR